MNVIIPNPEMYSNVFRWYLRDALQIGPIRGKICSRRRRKKEKREKKKKKGKKENKKKKMNKRHP